MTVYTPRSIRRAQCSTSEILVGAPVTAATEWSEYALSANWVRGKGAQLVAFTSPGTTITSGSTRTFHFRARTRNVAVERIWHLQLRSAATTAGSVATVRAPASSGTSRAYGAPFFREALQPATYVETVASKATATVDLSIDITASSGDVVVDGISCYEQDRAGLGDNTTDYGVLVDTIRGSRPILATENQSAYGVGRSLTNLDARRTALYSWVRPSEAPLTRTSATPLAALVIGAPVQTQKLSRSDTTGQVYWSVYGKVAAGAGGFVSLYTSLSGVSGSIGVTGTSFAWMTPLAIDIACDDFDEADGLQAATWDELTWTYQGDGTNLMSIAGLCVWVESAA